MDYQNIFNRDFYPTPREVFDQMATGENLTDAVILEPSAGSGNIVRYCYEYGARTVKACEINEVLNAALSAQCSVIAADFLQVQPSQVVDVSYIIMNPPFSTAEKHLLHAWEVAPAGSTIISLYPTARMTRCYGDAIKVRELVDLYGSREDIGDAFDHGTAERRTGTEVSILRLYRPAVNSQNFDDLDFDLTPEGLDEIGSGTEGVIKYDALREMVSRYRSAVAQFDAVQQANERINEDISTFANCHIRFAASGRTQDGERINSITRERFRCELQKAAWHKVFLLLNVQKYSTNALREKIARFVETSEARPFIMRNIYMVVNAVVQNIENIMNECIVRAFDTICNLSADNSTAGEKWKTNSNYMVNQRFIIDGLHCELDTGFGIKQTYNLRYTYFASSVRKAQAEDLYKALCFVCGKPVNEEVFRPFEYDVVQNCKDFGTWYYFDWFRVRFYKKGTMHFEFMDINVWYRFNQIAAEAKGWKIGSQKSCRTRRVWRDIPRPAGNK